MRAAGWGGVLFVVLSGAIVVLSPFWPPLGAPADVVVDYYREHRMPFLVGNYLAAAAAIPSFLQIGGLVMLIKRAEGERGWLWIAVLSSVVLAHAVGALALAAYQVVPFELGPGQEAVAKGFSDFAGVAFAFFMAVLSAFVALTSWAVLETRVLPRWYAFLGVPIAGACLAGSLGSIWSEPAWLAGGGILDATATSAFFLWCLILALLFLRMPPGQPARR